MHMCVYIKEILSWSYRLLFLRLSAKCVSECLVSFPNVCDLFATVCTYPYIPKMNVFEPQLIDISLQTKKGI